MKVKPLYLAVRYALLEMQAGPQAAQYATLSFTGLGFGWVVSHG